MNSFVIRFFCHSFDISPVALRCECLMMRRCVCSTGNEAPTSRSLISEFIRPLQISGDKPELLSVKPTFLTRSRTRSPARAFLSEVSDTVCLHPTWLLHVSPCTLCMTFIEQMESNKRQAAQGETS